MSFTRTIGALLFFLLSGCSAHASEGGAHSGGGGDAISCGKEVYLADLAFSVPYNHAFNRLPEKTVLDAIVAYLAAKDAAQGRLVAETIQHLIPDWVTGPLPDLKDDHLKLSFWHGLRCKKQQLVIQRFATHTVQISKPLFDQLTHAQRAFVWIHEAFIAIHQDESARNGDTHAVRDRVKAIFSADDFVPFVLKKAFGEDGVRRDCAEASRVVVRQCTWLAGGLGDSRPGDSLGFLLDGVFSQMAFRQCLARSKWSGVPSFVGEMLDRDALRVSMSLTREQAEEYVERVTRWSPEIGCLVAEPATSSDGADRKDGA